MQRIGLHGTGFRDAGADLWEVGLVGIDVDEEGGGAGSAEGGEEGGVRLVAGADALDGYGIGGKEEFPIGDAEAGAGVTADVAAAKVIALSHADGGVAVVVEEEDFKVEVVGVDGAELLEILCKAAVAFDEDGAA